MKVLSFTINSRIALLIGALAAFFILSLFLVRGIVFEEGVPYTRDLVFPYDLAFSYDHSLYSWDDLHSQRNLEINKIPTFYFMSQFSALFGSESTIKGLLILTLFLIPSILFVTLFLFFRNKVQSSFHLALICSLPSLFYLFNPVVLDRISNHVFMMLGFALNPLILIAFMQTFQKDRIDPLRLLFIASLLTVSSMISTHNIFYILPILIFLGLIYVFTVKNSRKMLQIVRGMVYMFGIYFLLNFYWILPLSYNYASSTLSPSYTLSVGDILKLSQFNSVSNIFKLIGGGGWQTVLQYPNFNQAMIPLTIILSYVVQAFSLLTLIWFRTNKTIIGLGILFVFIFILSLGIDSPIPLYSWLYSTAPFSSLTWLYRDATRLLQYLVLIYSVFLSFSLYKVIHSRNRYIDDVKPAVIILLGAGIVLSPSFYTFVIHGGDRLLSSPIPSDYLQTYKILRDTKESLGVLWLPMKQYYLYEWNKVSDEVAGDFHFVSSPKTTYGFTTQSSVIGTKFWNYFYNDLLNDYRSNQLGELLSLFNIKYVIVHDDLIGIQKTETEKILKILNLQRDLVLRHRIGDYHIYENTEYDPTKDKFYTLPKYLDKMGRIESFIAEPLPVKLPQQQLDWVTVGNVQSEYTLKLTKGTNVENLDTLSFEIYTNKENQDHSLDIILNTNGSAFKFIRNLNSGEWNSVDLDLRGAKLGSADTGSQLNLQNVTDIVLSANGSNSFVLKNMRFDHRSGSGSYDSVELLDNWKRQEDEKDNTIRFDKISPTEYNVHSNSTLPYFLIFVESYDPNWKARYEDENGKTKDIDSVPVFSSLNGFKITETGNVVIEIIYETQEYVNIGAIVSAGAVGAICLYIIIRQIRTKRKRNQYESALTDASFKEQS